MTGAGTRVARKNGTDNMSIMDGAIPGSYVQEDPYVVYAPPVVVEPPSGINIIIPRHIR